MRSHSPLMPIITVNRKAGTPLYEQVYREYRAAILRGDIRPGQQVPSSRDLAGEIKVSRFAVLQAYAQLHAEGYFESKAGAGTFVAPSLPEQFLSMHRSAQSTNFLSGPRPISHLASLWAPLPPADLRRWGSFGVHQPALEEFPFQVWSNLVARHSRNPPASAVHNIDPLGSERFRQEICNYLRTARGVNCDFRQIMVVSGSQQALDITARVLFDDGNKLFMEEPGYSLARRAFTAARCRIITVPVDRDGMDIAQGEMRHKNVRAAFVTPSHQFPLGWTMSIARRLQLLDWAQRTGAWIIEDDYDSEYRYGSKPIASLQGLDVNSRVIYIGTFSKVLLPSLRVGYLVIPPDLVDHFAAVRFAIDIFSPYLNQEVLADFMHLGHFGKHIRQMRQLYGERRQLLIRALQDEFGDFLEIHGSDAGMHLTVSLPEGYDDQEIVRRAAQERLWLWNLSSLYLDTKPRHGFILGFGSTPTAQITQAVRRLRSVVMAGENVV
jgi:GntR family transcriptional regulator/MocR family aminotransferase